MAGVIASTNCTVLYKPEDLIGTNFSELLHPDWAEHFRQNFPCFKAIGEVLGVEFHMKKKTGSLFSCLLQERSVKSLMDLFDKRIVFSKIFPQREHTRKI
jgi:hypothetical protein